MISPYRNKGQEIIKKYFESDILNFKGLPRGIPLGSFFCLQKESVFSMLMKITSFPSHFFHFQNFWQAKVCGGRPRNSASAGFLALAYFNTLPQFYAALGSWIGGNEHPVASQHLIHHGSTQKLCWGTAKWSSILWEGQQWGRELPSFGQVSNEEKSSWLQEFLL